MRLRGLGLCLYLVSCTDPPPPPPVIAPRVEAVKPAPPPPEPIKPEAVLPLPPPERVARFPDEQELEEEVESDAQLLGMLKRDPARAEAALHKLETPDAWQVSIVAQFALARGEKSSGLEAEKELPAPPAESELVEGPGEAWISVDAAPIASAEKKGAALSALAVNTKVEVTAIDGEWADVSVPVAQTVIYADTGAAPSRIVSTPLVGRVSKKHLARRPYEVEALMRSALAEDPTDEGKLRAVATWLLAWRVERSERTREGLLDAAFVARRASTLVRAALAKNLAPASGVRFAWSCVGEDPASATWLEVTKTRPKALPESVCVSGVDARERCPDDTKAALKKAAATKEWLESVKLAPKPWLRFTVDAREPRQVLVVTTPLAVADPCSEFEEVTFQAASGQLRRLSLPLGTRATTIWVPVSSHSGAEFSIPSAASERLAISWLRARGHYRWTVGGKGELQPSLGVNARAFEVPEDVVASGYAIAPERDCSCD
jgi:hypothetical protein